MQGLWRILTAVLSFVLVIASGQFPAQAAEPAVSVSAESAVLLSAETGTVLYDKNADTQRGMASTTKIMTALLALEYADEHGNPAVKITEEMVAVEGSSMGLRAGDSLTLSDLTAGMMATSGNDAANAVALTVGGSSENFAELMNARAAELSLTNTHFVTPSGLDDPEHYSTARDMAQLTRAALQNEAFSEIVSQTNITVELQSPQRHITYQNHNKLLTLYEGCIGVKTGYTKKSGRCLVSAARRDGVTLICVTLSAPDDWNDHTVLLDYGFSQAKTYPLATECKTQLPVVGGVSDTVTVTGKLSGTLSLLSGEEQSLIEVRYLPRFAYAPICQGDELGTIELALGGTVLYSAPLTAVFDVAEKPKQGFWERVRDLFGGA